MDQTGIKFNRLIIRYFILMGIIIAGIVSFLYFFFGYSVEQGFISNDWRTSYEIFNTDVEMLENISLDTYYLTKDSKYISFDQEKNTVETNMNVEEEQYYANLDLDKISNDAKSANHFVGAGVRNNKSYYLYAGDNNTIIVEPPLKYLLSIMNIDIPAIPFYIGMGIFLIFIIIFFFSKLIDRRLKKEIRPIVAAVENIENENLDFISPRTGIREFNRILYSLEKMRNSLKKSLIEQWRREEKQRYEISALIHDIKTPITVVKGNSEILQEEELNETQGSMVSAIYRNSTILENYIERLMDVLHNERKANYKMELFSSERFVEDLMKSLHPILQSKKIKVKLINNSKRIYGDQEKLDTALRNLILNAIEQNPKDKEIVLKLLSDEMKFKFIIEDQGEGFTKEALLKGKDKFYTAGESRSGKHLGLGLYLADEISRNHKGSLTLENKEEGGARVILEIPQKTNNVEKNN